MKENYGGMIFVTVVVLSIMSAVLTVVYDKQQIRVVAAQKCAAAGWVWFTTENKCIMVKEVK